MVENLRAEDNNLSGGIPTEWGSMTSLKGLDLDDNPSIGGTIPTELGRLRQLEHLELFRTGLTGPIITEIGLMTRLVKVELGTCFHFLQAFSKGICLRIE